MLAILAAVLLSAASQYDTVFTADGGRILGTVVEEGPQGITVQLPDGTARRLERQDVTRIEYKDGSISTPSRPPPPPPAYQPPPPAYQPAPPSSPPPPANAPPPAYRPPPPGYGPPPPAYGPPPPGYAPPPPAYGPPPAYRPPPVRHEPPPPTYADPRGGMPPIFPVYGSFGIGGSFLSGRIEDPTLGTTRADDIFDPQLGIQLEGGLRLNPHLALGLYVDIGVGEPARDVRNRPECVAASNGCTATTGAVGVLLRHTFQPRAHSTPWLSVGTGFEWGSITLDDHASGGGGMNDDLFSYTGWEVVRLMAGVDLRSNPVFGVGLYGGVALGRFTRFHDDILGDVRLEDDKFHTTVQAGLRFTLFP